MISLIDGRQEPVDELKDINLKIGFINRKII